jgi:single-stranded-DNA-specific exonuclease
MMLTLYFSRVELMKGMKKSKNISRYEKWEVLGRIPEKVKASDEDIVNVLLKNRGLKTKKEKEEFLKPKLPVKLRLKDAGLKKVKVKKAITRLKKAFKDKEKIVIYGDYDADGVCATAILWEALYYLGFKVVPYIPERFEEGYGLNSKSIEKIKSDGGVDIIITVDNGIVANDAVQKANELGIDVVVTDHHQEGKKLPGAFSIIHTTNIGGAGIAWFFARELRKEFESAIKNGYGGGLDLAAIGTVSDQIPLLGVNRSLVKYGLEELKNTPRLGLLALFEKAGVKKSDIGVYDIGFIIAPRINAMGRMEHAINSLRLLCTKDKKRASKLATLLNKTNFERQKVVDEVLSHAQGLVSRNDWEGIIIVAHESYHEGVIGLAASKIVEKYYRPAIVLSKGDEYSKASARSISGFNIIENIRKLGDYLENGGGHPMAAGFTIPTEKLDEFSEKLKKISSPLLTQEVLEKKLKIDMEIDFSKITDELYTGLTAFEPTGIGNPTPSFIAKGVEVLDVRSVGRDASHLKMKLMQSDRVMDAIGFGFGDLTFNITPDSKLDIVFNIDENYWNNVKSLQVKLKDVRIS